MTVAQLQDLARNIGLERYSNMRKAELMDALMQHYNQELNAIEQNYQTFMNSLQTAGTVNPNTATTTSTRKQCTASRSSNCTKSK